MKKQIKDNTKINIIVRGSCRGSGEDISLKFSQLKKAINNEEYCQELYEQKDISIDNFFNFYDEGEDCLRRVKKGKIYTGLDCFGEGYVAIGATFIKNLIAAILDFIQSEEEECF